MFPIQILSLLFALIPFGIFAAPASPFGSISSTEDNSIFDPVPSFSRFGDDRSQLPGVQVYPSLGGTQMPFQSFPGNFLRQRSLGSSGGQGSLDLETWTKNHAVRMNQENAVIAQLAQMAPHRRNQLVRDVTNGNASAANELITRLLRDLAASPHGQMAFGNQFQQQAALLSMLDQQQNGGVNSLQNAIATGQFAQGNTGALPLPLQLQMMANQRQMLMNGGQNRLLLPSNQQQFNGAFMPSMGTGLSPSQQSQIMNDRLLRQQLLMLQTRSAISPSPPNPFLSSSNGADFADLSRPSGSPFSNSQQQGFTQISPLSQSQSLGGIGRTGQGNGNTLNDFGKTLSGAGISGISSSSTTSSPFNSGFLRGFDDSTVNGEGRGFVDDLDPEELFGRRPSGTTGVGTVQRKRSRMAPEGGRFGWQRNKNMMK